MDKYKSVRVQFEKCGDEYKLVNVTGSMERAFGTDDLSDVGEITGTWAELVDRQGRILYRKHIYAMLHSVSRDREKPEDKFDILLPARDHADKIRLYAPPAETDGIRPVWGRRSELLGEYEFPEVPPKRKYAMPELPCDICGEGRGEVTGMTLIKSSGNPNAHNVVILAEKFGESDRDSFHDVASRCVSFLYSRPPFDTITGYKSMNIWLVDIHTYSSDSPYFHVKYKAFSTHVDWNKDNVNKVCNTLFEDIGWGIAAVIVNDKFYDIGTASYRQFVISVYNEIISKSTPQASFQHEFGHAFFQLADEYVKHDEAYTGTEPGQPNVTICNNREKLKWRTLVEDNTPIPTPKSFWKKNKGKAGCYEGAFLYKYGIYKGQCECVMNDHRDADGYYCKVCTEHALLRLRDTIEVYVPVPGVLYYSDIKKSWENLYIAAGGTKKQRTIENYPDFDELLDELVHLDASGQALQEIFRNAGVTLNDAVILPTDNDISGGLSTWYIRKENGEMYYLIADGRTTHPAVILGYVLLPDFPAMQMFDGINIGLQQHVFCITDGSLYHGKMDSEGEFKDFAEQKVQGLEKDLHQLSVTYKSGNPLFYVAAVSQGKVLLGAYSLVADRWDEKFFQAMPDSEEDAVYEFVKIMQAGSNVYVLIKSANGVEIRLFNAAQMCWKDTCGSVLPETQSVIKADWAYFRDRAWMISLDDDLQIKARSVKVYGDELQIEDCSVSQDKLELEGVITSFGTTVIGTKLHMIYTSNNEVNHAVFDFVYHYEQCKYNLMCTGAGKVEILNGKKYPVTSCSIHNNGSVIYMIVSGAEKVSE